MTTTTLTVEELLPEQTPAPIKIASRSTVDNSVLDMSTGGWTCNVRLEYPYGTEIGAQTPITDTIQVDGVPHFNVKIPIAWADQLTALDETYFLIVRTRNDALQQRDVHIKPLKVTLSPTVEVDDDAALIETVAALDAATGPTALPAPLTLTQLRAQHALIGDDWEDQETEPGRVEPDRSLWRFRWLARQTNQVRDSINAILAYLETIGSSLSSIVENSFIAYRASDPTLAAATVDEWLSSKSALVYERDFGDGFQTTYTMAHTAGDVVDATVVNNLTNRPIGIAIDWLTTPGQIIVGPFATAPAVDQMHLIVEGKNP